MDKLKWNKWKNENYGNIEALVHFAEKNAPNWFSENIISAEEIPSALVPVLEEHDWKTIVTYLQEITDKPSEKFYGTDDFTGSLIHLSWDETIKSLEEELSYSGFFNKIQ